MAHEVGREACPTLDIKACKSGTFGRLAQLGEHQLDKLGVTGSSPVPPILTIGLAGLRRVSFAVGCPFLVQLGQHG
jgi:hypothetical protein